MTLALYLVGALFVLALVLQLAVLALLAASARLDRWAAGRVAHLMLSGAYDRGMGEGELGRTLWNTACYISPDDQNGLHL